MHGYAKKLDLEFAQSGDLDKTVGKFLLVLGFQSRLIGTKYLAEAITLKYDDDRLTCRNLYNTIATHHGATAGGVERAIRHTIESCRKDGNITGFNSIVGCNAIDHKFDTTNSEFISLVSNWLHWVRHDNNSK